MTDLAERVGLDVRPVAGRIGAVIHGADLSEELDDATVAGIRLALTAWRVVFFRGQRLDAGRQVAFASRLGPLTRNHPNQPLGATPSPVLELVDTRANHWHTDVSFVDRPPFASVLAQVQTPAFGADTAWANTVAAYESLPAPLRTLADSIDVVHSNQFDYGTLSGNAAEQARLAEYFASNQFETIHPAVRLVEETGERSLFLGGFATRIVGFSPHQSRSILDLLQSHVTRIEHTVRWHWEPGDVAIWDNRTTQHTSVDDIDSFVDRHLRRVTVAGAAPVGPDGRQGQSVRGDSSSYTP